MNRQGVANSDGRAISYFGYGHQIGDS